MKLDINSRWLNGDDAWITVHSNDTENTVRILGLRDAAGTDSHKRVCESLQSLTSPPDGYFSLKVLGQTNDDPGSHLDLPFVLGVLAAANRVSRHVLPYWEFFGELHLGVLQAKKHDFSEAVRAAVNHGRDCMLPAGDKARLPAELARYCVEAETIADAVTHLRRLEPVQLPHRPQVKLEHRV